MAGLGQLRLIIVICRDTKVSRARDNKGYLHVSKDRQGFLNYVQRWLGMVMDGLG